MENTSASGITKQKRSLFPRRFLPAWCGLFAVLVFLLLSPLLVGGKSLIWTADGRSQYYPYLYYMGNTLRDFFSGLLHGRLQLPLYDLMIGPGDDAGSVLRLHLLDLLSVFVPGRYTEALYNCLTVLRLFLAGLAFSAYGLMRRWKPFYVLTGAALYLSCGYVLKPGLANPTFLSAMILLPMLLLCADRILQGEKCLMMVVVTALGFINNYYFMYQCSIALAFYCLFRLPAAIGQGEERAQGSEMLRRLIRLAALYLVGAAISMVFFLPVLLRLFASARLSDAYTGSLFSYGLSWLWNTLGSLFAPHLSAGSNTHLNFAAPALAAAVFAFTMREKKKGDLLALRASLILECAALLIPAAGLVMNGMGGVSNRWTYMIAFSLSCALAAAGEQWESPRPVTLVITAVLTAGYGLLIPVLSATGEKRSFLLTGLVLLLVCLAWMTACFALSRRGRMLQAGLPILILISAFVFSRAGFGPADSTHFYGTRSYSDAGSLFASYTDSRYGVLADLKDGSFWRADTSFMTTGDENSSLILGYNGISMYNSILNASVIETLREQESIGINAIHRLHSLDGRMGPEAMAGVRYFLAEPGNEDTVPYGFALRQDVSSDSVQVYEGGSALPFGYAAAGYISAETYDGLTALEKQQIMLQGAVLSPTDAGEEDPAAEAASRGLAEITQCEAGIEQEKVVMPDAGESTTLTAKGVKVADDGGSFTVEMPCRAGYECYVRFRGLYRNKDYSFVRLDTPQLTKTITLRARDATYSLHRSNYLVCLGTAEEDGTQTLKVTFPEKGGYRLKGMSFLYVPVDRMEEQISALAAHPLENLTIDGGDISGTISLEEESVLVLQIPWREGWHASADGQETRLFRANGMYTGLFLSPGQHSLHLTYRSPGIVTGAWITLAGLAAFVILILLDRKKRKGGA